MNKITVTQICKKAEINRVTFYKYYQDTFDVYEKIVDQILNDSSDSMMKICSEKSLKEAIEAVITDVGKRIDRYQVLFSGHVDAYHQSKSMERCMLKISSLEIPGLVISDEQHALLQAFLSFGGSGVLTTWVNGGMKQPPNEIAELLYSYIVQILKLYRNQRN